MAYPKASVTSCGNRSAMADPTPLPHTPYPGNNPAGGRIIVTALTGPAVVLGDDPVDDVELQGAQVLCPALALLDVVQGAHAGDVGPAAVVASRRVAPPDDVHAAPLGFEGLADRDVALVVVDVVGWRLMSVLRRTSWKRPYAVPVRRTLPRPTDVGARRGSYKPATPGQIEVAAAALSRTESPPIGEHHAPGERAKEEEDLTEHFLGGGPHFVAVARRLFRETSEGEWEELPPDMFELPDTARRGAALARQAITEARRGESAR